MPCGISCASRIRAPCRARGGRPILEYGTGGSETQFGFDPWGLRRKGDHADAGIFYKDDLSTSGAATAHFTPRGFTGHQHLDGLGLIHMNGRIYDPVIGRFLQADPIVQEPFNGQNFNRYTYVLNNPLAYTDPTGYSFWTEVRRPVGGIIAATLALMAGQPEAASKAADAAFAAVAAGAEGQAIVAAANVAYSSAIAPYVIAGGFAAGGIAGGNLESALAGAFSSMMFFGVGEMNLGSGTLGNVAAHAGAGCVSSLANGGSCRAGALSAGFAEFAGPRLLTDNMVLNTAVHATLGGIGSRLAGGKFANGAMTGAFGYLFNCVNHDCGSPESNLTPVEGPGMALGEFARGAAVTVTLSVGAPMAIAAALDVSAVAAGDIAAAHIARRAAASEIFATRTAPELQGIFSWGRGLEGVKAARAGLDANKMATIRESIAKSEVETIQKLYQSAAKANRGGSVAIERAKYMTEILKRW